MKKIYFILMASFFLIALSHPLQSKDKIKVITTLTDLASLTQAVGGDRVEVEALVKGTQDPHQIEVLPSYMVKLRNADLFVIIGMDLEMWAYPLRDGSRNSKLLLVDCSQNIERLEVPTYKVDPSHGDIHLYGNPHYWLDPENGKLMMQTIFEALVKVSPEDYAYFENNLKAYRQKLDEKMAEWQTKAEALKGKQVIFFHNSWPYFNRRFGVVAANFIEPKPGVTPSPSHTARLIQQVKDQGIQVIAKEPFFDDRVPKMISRQTGAKLVVLPTSVGGVPEVKDYVGLFDYIIDTLVKAFEN
ncbi:MAG: metal ABC transporter substrate-binding protein [candidate division KSB1 bacterium]|nr:metal ABC transporter substrate-binding protein [candidate division KSB1 bacterium]